MAHWRKRTILAAVSMAVLTLIAFAGAAADTVARIRPPDAAKMQRALQTRPHRLEGPLRELNLSDVEVREIVAAARTIYPGFLINISAVTDGCPCEDGPACTSRVWVVAHQETRTLGLMLSRIGDEWVVGPLQQWWLDYERLGRYSRGYRGLSGPALARELEAYWQRQVELLDAFPVCSTKLS